MLLVDVVIKAKVVVVDDGSDEFQSLLLVDVVIKLYWFQGEWLETQFQSLLLVDVVIKTNPEWVYPFS